MKKSLCKTMLLSIAALTLLSGCQNSSATVSSAEEAKIYKIGILQYMEHPALNDAKKGFEDGLKELSVSAKIDYKNAEGDIPTASVIANQFSSEHYDLIYTIATPAAQAAKQAITHTPVLFSAVTDPVQSELLTSCDKPDTNITGTSDKMPTTEQLSIFKELSPSAKNIGILYNTSESNSEIQIREAQISAEELDLKIITVGVNTINDIPQALDSILPKIDGLYIITDNTVASSIPLIVEKTSSQKIPTVSAYSSAVEEGLLVTKGFQYYDLGKQTAVMAKKILVDELPISQIPVETCETLELLYNPTMANTLNLPVDFGILSKAKPVK